MKPKIKDLELAKKVFPFPLVKLWIGELALFEAGTIPEFHTTETITKEGLADILLQYVVPNETVPAFAGQSWALEWLAFTGLSKETEVVARGIPWLPDTLSDWKAPATHCPFGGEFGAPLYSASAYFRYFAKIASESPSARRRFKEVVFADAPENKTIITLDVLGDSDDGFITIDFWLPKSVMQAMGYAVLKNHVLGPNYRTLAKNRKNDANSWALVADVFARLGLLS